MSDLFKEQDSSSSESGDENQPGRQQDEMIFESNNIISLSKSPISHTPLY